MSTQRKSVLLVAGLLALLALSSLACSFSGSGVRTFSPVVDVVLTEEMLGGASGKASFQIGSPFGGWYLPFHMDGPYEALLDGVDRIETHDGYIRFIGRKDGLASSIDVSLWAEDGALKAQVTGVDIPGMELSDPEIVKINREMAQDLTEMVQETQGDVQFQKVEVTEQGLEMKIKVNVDLDSAYAPEIEIEIE